MLNRWKIVRSPQAPHSREDLFLERYEKVFGWALQLSGNDRQRAEDLTHDVFIQFTMSQSEMTAIHNLDGYIYGMVRNTQLSQARRALRLQNRSLPIVEYDSAEIGLQATDPREQIRTQDALRQICRYACVRKETSKAGSILILRFFHGYYPAEIAKVTRGTRKTVDNSLRMARSEAQVYLNQPERLAFMSQPVESGMVRGGFAVGIDEFLIELRAAIFESCRLNCPPRKDLLARYGMDSAAIDSTLLAHVVSCAACLDIVNARLGLALLKERYPTDTLGQDPGSGDGDGPDEPAGTGDKKSAAKAPSPRDLSRKYKKAMRNIFDHRPRELCVLVNGYLLGSQRIGSPVSELTLGIKGEERIDFVEVVSEQEVRMLALHVGSAPPDGAFEQTESVVLSDGRSLKVTLSFKPEWPSLDVVYKDPLFESEVERSSASTAESTDKSPEALPSFDLEAAERGSLWEKLKSRAFWFRPITATVMLAVLLIAAVLVVQHRSRTEPLSAATLLRNSIAAEEKAARNQSEVLHRVIAFEERNAATKQVLSRRRIEVWQSAEKNLKVSRLYDEKGFPLAGEWTKSKGETTLYQRGAHPQTVSPVGIERSPLTFSSVWRADLSSTEFSRLADEMVTARANQSPAGYVVSYQGADSNRPGLVSAALTLNRADLRPVEETLTLRQGDDLREYRFAETSYERRPVSAVPEAVFEPEPELGGSIKGLEKTPLGTGSSPAFSTPQPTVIATADLEVKVMSLLSRAGADMDDQTSVTRLPDGRLRVGGIVENASRKAEILRVLSEISSNPAVLIQVETVEEAQQRASAKPPDVAVSVQRVELGQGHIAAYPELLSYFSRNGANPSDEPNRFASHIVNQSSETLSHIQAMKRLSEQFSAEDLRTLSPAARAEWLAMIRSHALTVQRQTRRTREELQPIFFPVPPDSARDAIGITDDEGIEKAVRKLAELAASADRAISAALTNSNGAKSASAIKSVEFWRSLTSAEDLAAKIAAYR